MAVDLIYTDKSIDVSKEVDHVWSIANSLRGTYRADEYKKVIIPMTIIRRIECALEPTKDAVLKAFESDQDTPVDMLQDASGFSFYNTSRYNLKELLNDSKNIAVNLQSYIDGFSPNIRDIINSLEFSKEIEKMNKSNRILGVIKKFSELDLDPKTMDGMKMGYMFEDIIRRFSENAEAGDHYTPREIIRLMANIILAEGCDDLLTEGKVATVLDMACGTGGMLSTTNDFLKRLNPSVDVRLFGQEINPESYAICLADMLIKGQNAENIRMQDTMIADAFPDQPMRIVIANPPFGSAWGGKDAADGVEDSVRKENKLGFDGRFGAGLPGTGDMQLLFMQHAIYKMDETKGRAAIITNGSPLFSGGTTSGESQIRRYMLENDLIEAIIALPTELFYNTGIGIYTFILSKNKRPERRGKVQLINAVDFWQPLKRSLGNKRRELSKDDIKKITKLYSDFEENEYSKIFTNEEFEYKEFAVYQPLQRNYAIAEERIEKLATSGSLSNIFDADKMEELLNLDELSVKDQKKLKGYQTAKPLYEEVFKRLKANVSDTVYKSYKNFMPVLDKIFEDLADYDPVAKDKKKKKKDLIDKIAAGLSEMDKTAEIQRDKKGNIIYDPETKDTELVKLTEDVDEYFKREVYPYVPDAHYVYEYDPNKKGDKEKIGAEFPFTRFFYKYEPPKPADDLLKQFLELESELTRKVKELHV
jgi:type I restriction enzyme M protein